MTTKIPTLSRKEYEILHLLMTNGQMYGLQMVEASEGFLKRGTIYVTLSRMEDKGYIESRSDNKTELHSVPRRLYRPTGFGARVFHAWEMARAQLADFA